ncbi:hypothetical protein F4X86_03030 [Candidatus Saccharibacteria bacterium]|nr:hypothetical protein [Candidatus Saccharibacteria bacterium]
MSRLVGAEIRYTRLGYWMRQAPYGYASEKVETAHGKRVILKPHPEEAFFVREMFRLRAEGCHTDQEIADKLNDMGYRSRRGALLKDRHLWRMVRRSIYAGINCEKWTDGQPVKCAFEGLVSTESFNRANKGRRVITESKDGRIMISDHKEERYQTDKGKRDVDFPYKRFVTCPECRKPLLGSASRGGNGKYYPAYHCTKGDHNFRVSKQILEEQVERFVEDLQISPKYLGELFKIIENSRVQEQARMGRSLAGLDSRISRLEEEIIQTVGKIKLLDNQTAIKYMEADIDRLEKELAGLKRKREEISEQKSLDLDQFKTKLTYLVERLGSLFKQQSDPLKKAKLFDLLFDKSPSYTDLEGGTDENSILQMMNPVFAFISSPFNHMVTPRGIEPLFPE